MKTDVITYSIRDRKRKYQGADRFYQTDAKYPELVKEINSPRTQSRVRAREMTGYYGHGIRKLFGLMPPECSLVDGKMVCVAPAFVTTMLKADSKGNVSHQAEFLDNEYGQKAWKMYQNKVGGFSSVVFGNADMQFIGFDWVFVPNFKHNRGWVLDGIDSNIKAQLAREYAETVESSRLLIMDSIENTLERKSSEMRQELTALSEVVNEQEKIIASLQPKKEEAQIIESSQALFDNLSDDSFLSMTLPDYEIETDKPEKKTKPEPPPLIKALNRRFGR